jgi:hypothetical protein
MTEVVTLTGPFQPLTESERELLVLLLLNSWVNIRDDPHLTKQAEECEGLIVKLGGVDKRVYVG